MKKWIGVGLGVGVVIFGLLVVGGCGWAGAKSLQQILHGEWHADSRTGYVFQKCIGSRRGWLSEFLDNKTYIVLLQNAEELRSSGGFMGSYIKVQTKPAGISAMEVRDIYNADGQIKGHVEPPYPIQEAFSQGWWRLRDANWDTDFASASASIAWFLEQGGEGQIDGIIAMHTGTFRKLLEVLGPVYVHIYEETVTAKSLTILAQRYAEEGFQPGSTQKRDFLGAVGEQLKSQVQSLKPQLMAKVLTLIYGELRKGEMLVWMRNPDWQKQLEQWGWAGRLMAYGGDDYLYISESNLGANKANCCVERGVKQEVQNLTETLTLRWKNTNPFQAPKPPIFWGGDLRNYVRVVVPAAARMEEVSVGEQVLRRATSKDFVLPNSQRQGMSSDMYIVEVRDGYETVGFWALVSAQSEVQARIKYTMDRVPAHVVVQKQPGMPAYDYERIVEGKVTASARVEQSQRW